MAILTLRRGVWPGLLLLTACVRGGDAASDLAAGRQLFLSRGCAACHGSEGAGDGPASRSTARPPRDLRRADFYRYAVTAESIAQVIATGIDADHGGMPAHPFLPEAERRQIARFVLSLAKNESTKGP